MSRRGLLFVDRVNNYALSPELLMGAMVRIADLDPDDRGSFEGRSIAIVRYVAELNLPEDERADAVLSIGFRLEALARLEVANASQWRLTGSEEGLDLLHSHVVRCAAEEPLVRSGEEMRFDHDGFHRRLLAISDPAGQA